MPAQNHLCFLFVINPNSGGRDKAEFSQKIDAHFKDTEHRIERFETTGEDDLESLKKAIEQHKPDRVIAVGGDGTLKLAADATAETGLAIGMIPAGSANGMASELSLPSKIEEALAVITEGTAKPYDLVCVNEHYSLHLADIGLNAKLIKNFEEQPESRGLMGYAKEVFRTLRGHRSMRLEITLDGKPPIRRKAAMAVLANGRMYGSGVVLNKDGKLDDGRFELVILKDISLWRILKCLVTRHAEPGPAQEIFHCKKLHIKAAHSSPFQVDGEYLGKAKSLHAHVLPGAVQILVPASA